MSRSATFTGGGTTLATLTETANVSGDKVEPDAGEVGFGYDRNGNMTSVTPPTKPTHGMFRHQHTALTRCRRY
ncbi:MAG TPA: hypothetical protein VK540_18535 [Polyangiaceae bacterium]|nr:hypothetical protein [Polyangiaceae bacterium]